MKALQLLSWLAGLLVVGVILWQSSPNEIWLQLHHVRVGWLVASFAMNFPILMLAPLRSGMVLRRLGHRAPLKSLIPATILGFVAGSLTPAAAGDFLRPAALRAASGLDFERGIALVLYERAVSFYILLVTTLACLAIANLPLRGQALIVVAAGLSLLGPWAAGHLILSHLPHARAGPPSGRLAALLDRMLAMGSNVRFLLQDLKLLFAWSFLTVLLFACIALEIELLGKSISLDLSLIDAWLAYGGYAFATIGSLLPLGLGIGDGSLAAVLHALGATLEQGASAAILLRATSTLPQIVLAVGCYFYLRTRSNALVPPTV